MPFHVLSRGFFCLLFVGTGLSGGGQQRLVVIAHLGADHHLKLPGVGEAAFDHRQLFDLFRPGIRGLIQHKTQARDAVTHRRDIVAPANQLYQSVDVCLFYFAHDEVSSP